MAKTNVEGAFLPIGSITILTNVDANESSLFEIETAELVSAKIVSWIQQEFRKNENLSNLIITSVETRLGCIITTVGLGILVTGAGAAYKIVTDYDVIRKNLKKIIEDIKSLAIKTDKTKEKALTEADIEAYLRVPDKDKKYFAAGQEITIISESEIKRVNTITVMRDDIIEHIEEEKIVTVKSVKTFIKDNKILIKHDDESE